MLDRSENEEEEKEEVSTRFGVQFERAVSFLVAR